MGESGQTNGSGKIATWSKSRHSGPYFHTHRRAMPGETSSGFGERDAGMMVVYGSVYPICNARPARRSEKARYEIMYDSERSAYPHPEDFKVMRPEYVEHE